MYTKILLNDMKYFSVAFSVAVVAIFGGILFAHAQRAAGASIEMKKDANGLFAVTIREPSGIQSVFFKAPGKSRYGGELGSCPTFRVVDNVTFDDPADFTPQMDAILTDCAGNVKEFALPPPKGGATTAARVNAPETTAAPAATPASTVGGSAAAVPKTPAAARGGATSAVTYPVPELGNCKNEKECKTYCDDTAHIDACVGFAEAHGLIGSAEAEKGKKFAAALHASATPGGCASEGACRTYCEGGEHLDECIAFGEQNGFLSGEELAMAKKMLPLIKSGTTPGGCKGKQACELYCGDPAHVDACLAFAETHGVIPPEELAQAKKMLPLIKQGATPGRCASKAQCEEYCSSGEHIDECIAFGEKYGVIPPEELATVKKVLPLMKAGKTPGQCKTKAACDAYCGVEGHMDECTAFAVEAGFIKPEEAEAIKKAGGKGPGGCKSKSDCEAYCKDQSHIDECLEFGVRAGFVTPEEADMARKVGSAGGPGGCRSREECEAYCTDQSHADECAAFAERTGLGKPGGGGGAGGIPAGLGGPGGCASREACEAYCRTNPEACAGFSAPNREQEEMREELFEGERQRHLQVVPTEDPKIIACFRAKVGKDVFARRQAARLQGKDEALTVEDALRGCGATFVRRWQEVIQEAQTKRPADVACLKEKLGEETISRILSGEEVAHASWVIESECRFLPDASAPPQRTERRGPSQEEIQKRIEEETAKYRAQEQPQYPQAPQQYPSSALPSAPAAPAGIPEYCASFAAAPKCEYVGAPGTDAYNYCKQCFPER
ncbi:MAG: hypothetical protein HYV25_01960 [Candidatus Harrisonbacteria bacterium]|nr:hypothetical protein [Candidatus Harrisonbacteria bacterium]